MSYRGLILVLTLLVAALFAASLLIGPAGAGLGASLQALLTGEGGVLVEVMRDIRLPRAILGALIGGALGLAGAAMQGALRNPLAEPGLIGVSPAASLGAVLALQTGWAASFVAALPLAALSGAGLSVLLLFGLAGRRGSLLGLILAGVALSSLAGALTSLVLNLSPNPYAAFEIMFWMMGSLADRSMQHVWIAAPFIVLGAGLVLSCARALDALSLGEEVASSMGIRIAALRLKIVLGVAAMVGAATAVAGAIGFVGLVVPHVLRPLVGARPGALLPVSALGGAAVVLAADVGVRLISPASDLKLGVVTAIVGAPFFLRLVWRMRGQGL